jgi:adenylate cyclase
LLLHELQTVFIDKPPSPRWVSELPEGERRLAAIMFTDIVGYTALTQKSESLSLSLLEKHKKLVRPVFARHAGREVKTIGDAFLIEFASALEAVECAVEIQEILGDYNRDAPEKLLIRIGIHVGDVVHEGKDVLGDAVNIASRIVPLAEGGGICISEQVYSQVRNKVPYRMERLPAHTLKNVQYPVETYRVLLASGKYEAGSVAPKNRVAVLPLSNISPDPKDGYFADGLTEELITVLSHVQGLRVIARTSVDRYKTRDQGIAQIARELMVGSMIEGSVRIAGDRLRVSVQLIDASSEEHLWSENYDRRLDDIFEVQSDIAKRVAEKLKVKLLAKEEDRLDRRSVASMSVYKNYLKGRSLLAKREPTEMMESKQFFEKAIAEDPNYAPALAGLADAYFLLGDYWAMPLDEARRKSRELLSRALKLDPDLAEARASLGLNLESEYRFAEAESEFKRAIDLNPSYAMAHFWYASSLGALRRYEEQLEQLEIAEQLDPMSTVVLYNETTLLTLLGRKELAWEKLKKRSELDPSRMSKVDLESFYYYLNGDPQRALNEVEKHPELHGEVPIMANLAVYSAAVGDKKTAMGWLEKLKALPDTTAFKAQLIAFIYLELRDYDQFFAWANKAVDSKSFSFTDAELYPNAKRISGDPRHKALLKRVNLDTG